MLLTPNQGAASAGEPLPTEEGLKPALTLTACK